MLRYDITILYYTMLCYAMLCYATLHYTTLHSNLIDLGIFIMSAIKTGVCVCVCVCVLGTYPFIITYTTTILGSCVQWNTDLP